LETVMAKAKVREKATARESHPHQVFARKF
jgi:hypothetical protein